MQYGTAPTADTSLQDGSMRNKVRAILAELATMFATNVSIYGSIGETSVSPIAEKFSANVASGCYRWCLLFDEFVVKFPKFPSRENELRAEAQFYRAARKTQWRRHFPRTLLIGGNIQLQERCNPDNFLFTENRRAIMRMAAHLGIEDVHGGNIGWRLELNGPVPVFIDAEFRGTPNFGELTPVVRRSWDI